MVKPPLILIVNDEPHIVHTLSVKLVQAGLRVACAADGYRALQSLNNDAPDLVIADEHMPGMNGRQLSEALIQNDNTTHLPVVLLTAHNRSIAPGDTYPANVKAVIGKPFKPSDAIDQVITILESAAPLEVA